VNEPRYRVRFADTDVAERGRWPVTLIVGPTRNQIGWIAVDDLAQTPNATMAAFLREAADVFEQQGDE
jgi:hypothetical protein